MTACRSNDPSAPATNAKAPAGPMTMASPVPPAPASTAPSPTVKTKVDVCSLISGADLQNIQGEQPKETQRSDRSEEHTSELQSQSNLVCRLLLEKKKNNH